MIAAMDITAPCVVTLTWRLTDTNGQLIDELTDPVEFFYGGDDLLAKVEEAIAGHAAGHQAHLHLEPEHAFGDYNPALVCFEARRLFPKEVAPGMQYEGLPPGSATPDMPRDVIYTVTEVYPDHVVLDGNHPLAGMALRLALKVRDVRPATAQEIAQRRVGEPVFGIAPNAPSSRRLQ